MSTWADVRKGDVVELGGRPFTVAKYKAKGKRAAIVVVSSSGRFDNEVKLKDKVKIVPATSGKRAKLRDETGAQQRWASKKEGKPDREGVPRESLPAGDRAVTSPPTPPGVEEWAPHTKAERLLDDLLSARLVAEAPDEAVGYYVPPVDAETVGAHWMLMHEGDDWVQVGETELMEHHKRQHEAALQGLPLKVNHWHTETRPNHA